MMSGKRPAPLKTGNQFNQTTDSLIRGGDSRWITNSVLFPVYVLDERTVKERLGEDTKFRPYSDAGSTCTRSSVRSSRASAQSKHSQVSSSFRTTESQHLYITALESMLQKERAKRLEVESQLSARQTNKIN